MSVQIILPTIINQMNWPWQKCHSHCWVVFADNLRHVCYFVSCWEHYRSWLAILECTLNTEQVKKNIHTLHENSWWTLTKVHWPKVHASLLHHCCACRSYRFWRENVTPGLPEAAYRTATDLAGKVTRHWQDETCTLRAQLEWPG